VTVKVRTRFQPCHEIEVDEAEAAVLKHQGHLWAGTDAELAELLEEAGLGAPPASEKKTSAGPTAAAETKKETQP